MSEMPDRGEPVSVRRRDRQAAEARARRNALILVALVGGVFVVNGILLVLLVALLEALGWWGTTGLQGIYG
jgi:hypothetical protein